MKIFKNKSGLIYWIFQRITALFFLSYTVYIFSYLYSDWKLINYYKWVNIFKNETVKFLTIVAFISILKHSLIGIKIILQDYVQGKKAQKFTLTLSSILSTLYIICAICILFGKNI